MKKQWTIQWSKGKSNITDAYYVRAMVFMVEQGLGAALCFDLGAVFENLRFVPLAPRMETGSVLVWKKNQALSMANTLFIQHIRNTF